MDHYKRCLLKKYQIYFFSDHDLSSIYYDGGHLRCKYFAQQNSEVNKTGVLSDDPQLTQQLGQVKTDDFEFKAIDSTKKAQIGG